MHNANPSSLLISIALLSPCCVASLRPVMDRGLGSWAGLYSTALFYFYIWARSVGGESPAQTRFYACCLLHSKIRSCDRHCININIKARREKKSTSLNKDSVRQVLNG